MTVRGSFQWKSIKRLSLSVWKPRLITHPHALGHTADDFANRWCLRSASGIRNDTADSKYLPEEASHDVSSESTKIPGVHEADDALRVYIVAGEPSGDAIGSRLMSSLRKLVDSNNQCGSTYVRYSHILDSHKSAGAESRSEFASGLIAGSATAGSGWGEESEGTDVRREGLCDRGMERGRDAGAWKAVRKQWKNVSFAGVGGYVMWRVLHYKKNWK